MDQIAPVFLLISSQENGGEERRRRIYSARGPGLFIRQLLVEYLRIAPPSFSFYFPLF